MREKLFVKGSLPNPDIPTVAIVGARFCSEYGRYMARLYGNALAQAGFQVINGMSLGIEGIALDAALKAGGRAYAVFGSGVDVCYPPENRHLYEKICAQGGVISEKPEGTKPDRSNLAERRKLIAELADAVIVIEARKNSGSLIEAELSKNVFAIPGRSTDRLSDGTNLLIMTGRAKMTMMPEDFIPWFQCGKLVLGGNDGN